MMPFTSMLLMHESLMHESLMQESQGSPGGSEIKASACNAGNLGSIPGLGRSPGEGNGNALQYSCLDNPMHRGPWWATVHGVARSQTRLSDQTTTTQPFTRGTAATPPPAHVPASLLCDPGKALRLSGFLAPWKQGRSSSYVSEVL